MQRLPPHSPLTSHHSPHSATPLARNPKPSSRSAAASPAYRARRMSTSPQFRGQCEPSSQSSQAMSPQQSWKDSVPGAAGSKRASSSRVTCRVVLAGESRSPCGVVRTRVRLVSQRNRSRRLVCCQSAGTIDPRMMRKTRPARGRWCHQPGDQDRRRRHPFAIDGLHEGLDPLQSVICRAGRTRDHSRVKAVRPSWQDVFRKTLRIACREPRSSPLL